jgi:hypothetical protein
MLPKNSTSLPKLAAVSLAAAAFIGSAAGAASADSIAYIKGGDVWLTTTDAARQFQVTGTGGYVGVSQADDGTMLATTADNSLVRLDRYGSTLSSIRTPVSQPLNGGSTVFEGPYDADISPDGRTVGYSFMKFGLYQYPDGSRDADMYDGHGFTKSDALTGFTDTGYKYAKDWESPEFLDNNTVLVSNGPGYPSTPFAIETVGSGDPRSWFADPDNMHPMEATISRNRRFIAAVVGTGRLGLSVYRIGDGRIENATINKCMTYSDAAGQGYAYNSPTISGDGKVLAWGSGRGLDIAPLGDGSTTCPDPRSGDEFLPGASQPDWGPADVPASRPADKPLPGGAPTGGSPAAPTPPAAAAAPARTTPATPQGGPASGLPNLGLGRSGSGSGSGATSSLTVKVGTARLAAILRSGLTVTVTAPQAGRISVVARNGRTTAGSGTATAKAGTPVLVKVKLSAKAKRTLRHAHSATLTLTITTAGSTRTVTAKIKR